eukprot:SAG31_NODE_1172_length_9556_cov_42.164111_2_plen_971_part_00
MYILIHGKVEMYVTSTEGWKTSQKKVKEIESDENDPECPFFCEYTMQHDMPRTATCTCASDTTVLVLQSDDYHKVLRANNLSQPQSIRTNRSYSWAEPGPFLWNLTLDLSALQFIKNAQESARIRRESEAATTQSNGPIFNTIQWTDRSSPRTRLQARKSSNSSNSSVSTETHAALEVGNKKMRSNRASLRKDMGAHRDRFASALNLNSLQKKRFRLESSDDLSCDNQTGHGRPFWRYLRGDPMDKIHLSGVDMCFYSDSTDPSWSASNGSYCVLCSHAGASVWDTKKMRCLVQITSADLEKCREWPSEQTFDHVRCCRLIERPDKKLNLITVGWDGRVCEFDISTCGRQAHKAHLVRQLQPTSVVSRAVQVTSHGIVVMASTSGLQRLSPAGEKFRLDHLTRRTTLLSAGQQTAHPLCSLEEFHLSTSGRLMIAVTNAKFLIDVTLPSDKLTRVKKLWACARMNFFPFPYIVNERTGYKLVADGIVAIDPDASFLALSEPTTKGRRQGFSIWKVCRDEKKHIRHDRHRSERIGTEAIVIQILGQNTGQDRIKSLQVLREAEVGMSLGTEEDGADSVRIWNILTGECIYSIPARARCATLGADGTNVMLGLQRHPRDGDSQFRLGHACIVEFNVSRISHNLRRWHTQAVYVCSASRTSKVLSASLDGTMVLYDLARDDAELIQTGHSGFLQYHINGATAPGLAMISRKGDRAISADHDCNLCIWELSDVDQNEKVECKTVCPSKGYRITDGAISWDGEHALIATLDGEIGIWNLISTKCEMVHKAHSPAVVDTVGSRQDGKWFEQVVSCDMSAGMDVIVTASGATVNVFKRDGDGLVDVEESSRIRFRHRSARSEALRTNCAVYSHYNQTLDGSREDTQKATVAVASLDSDVLFFLMPRSRDSNVKTPQVRKQIGPMIHILASSKTAFNPSTSVTIAIWSPVLIFLKMDDIYLRQIHTASSCTVSSTNQE